MFFESKELEYADIRVLVAGSRLVKLDGIEFGVTADKAHIFGEGDMPLDIQSGNRTPTGNLMLKLNAMHQMNDEAVKAGGRDVTDLEFDIVVVYRAAKNRKLRTRSLVGCQVSDFKESWNQGDKESKVTLPFLFLDLL